ncbi:hypothetical protein DFJ63DRAFT_311027 [Scheffersomyces coipomensis]|uniref:uncharacterized protein n=1 Tax=Scheffersomyces coipomensis TaxID=1788519 RepID=UPI00315D5195
MIPPKDTTAGNSSLYTATEGSSSQSWDSYERVSIAINVNTPPDSAENKDKNVRMLYASQNCISKKIRCSKYIPCEQCTAKNLVCNYKSDSIKRISKFNPPRSDKVRITPKEKSNVSIDVDTDVELISRTTNTRDNLYNRLI